MRYQVREKLFRLGEDNDILNDAGQPVLKVDGKVLSIHGLMLVNDLTGAEVGRVSRKLVALLATYEIALTSGVTAEVHQRFTGPFHPKWNVSVSGGQEMEMSGNFFGHDFTLTANGQTIATVSKAWISLADSYGVDIAEGQNDLLVLCSVLALEAEQDRTQEHHRGEGPLGGLGGGGGLFGGGLGGLGDLVDRGI
ncbi:MAG TPA: LURP-one-related family protein [Candidatus Saccharimonadales bacterium]|nr:LURP-one-related family protein [Candidatus Saccharimonadales bacterium]